MGVNHNIVLWYDFITIQTASTLHIPIIPPDPAVYFKYLYRILFTCKPVSHNQYDFITYLFYNKHIYLIGC